MARDSDTIELIVDGQPQEVKIFLDKTGPQGPKGETGPAGPAGPAGATGNGIQSYDSYTGISAGELNIYGLAKEPPALTIETQGAGTFTPEIKTEHIVEDDEEGHYEYDRLYIELTKGTDTYRYRVFYEQDLSSLFDISEINGENLLEDTYHSMGNTSGSIYLYVPAGKSADFTIVPAKEGVAVSAVKSAIRYEDSYGYKIVKDMQPYVAVSESTLYPILRRLEQQKLLEVRSLEFQGRLRKYYHITQAGLDRIEAFRDDWKELEAINAFITRGERATG